MSNATALILGATNKIKRARSSMGLAKFRGAIIIGQCITTAMFILGFHLAGNFVNTAGNWQAGVAVVTALLVSFVFSRSGSLFRFTLCLATGAALLGFLVALLCSHPLMLY